MGGVTRTYWTPGEIARELRMSKMTIYRLIHSGQLPAIKVGGNFRVADRAFQAYIQQAQVVSEQETSDDE